MRRARLTVVAALVAVAALRATGGCDSPDTTLATMDGAGPDVAIDGPPAASADAPLSCPRPPSTLDTPLRPLHILFFTKETLFFHASHDGGDASMSAYLRSRGHDVTVSNDTALFTDAGLALFDVILFFVTSGNFLTDPQRAAFQRFVHAGKGVSGVHSASATELDSPFFISLIGGVFAGHGSTAASQLTEAGILVRDGASPLVSFLPTRWGRRDEWYYYRDNPAKNPALSFLLDIDEADLEPYRDVGDGGYPDVGFYGPAAPHPMAWTQTFECGRVFYTAMGHTVESYSEDLFLRFVAVGTEWAGAPATEM